MNEKILNLLLVFLFLLILYSCEDKIITFQGQNSTSVTIDWQGTFGAKDFDDVSEILPTADGGYIVIGSTLNIDWNFWVLKFDHELNLLWEKNYGGSNADFGKAIIETGDGNFILIGYTNSIDGNITINNGAYDVWVVKIDNNGSIIWQNCYGGSGNETVGEESIIPADIGGYIFTATSNSQDFDITEYIGGNDIWVVNINDSSQIVWDKTFGGTSDDFSNSIKLTSDSLYILSNFVTSTDGDINYNYGGKDIWLIRINQIGDLMWQKTIGGTNTENQCDMEVTSDAGLIVMTQTNSEDGDIQYNYGFKDIWYSKINATGNIEWNLVFGGSLEESLGDIKQLSDGSFVSVCESSSDDYYLGHNFGKVDICLVKISTAGDLEWTKVMGGSDDDHCNSLLEASDNSLIVAASTKSEDFNVLSHIGGFDFWLLKVQY
jgi:hypothetical protein